jgi:hypothetical protein
MYPLDIIRKFDEFLFQKKQCFEAVVIGGAALSILGVISRETRDVDVLSPGIPKDIMDSSIEFAKNIGLPSKNLKENWLNMGPGSLCRELPHGWENRAVDLFVGRAINLKTLGRIDFLMTKILAYCDRGFDLQDCIKMNPSKEELKEILPWVQAYDGNPTWPEYVHQRMSELARELGYEF